MTWISEQGTLSEKLLTQNKIKMSDHHNETFISKYIFSLDHKMIGKQFLITGMFMGTVGMLMSILLDYNYQTLENLLAY